MCFKTRSYSSPLDLEQQQQLNEADQERNSLANRQKFVILFIVTTLFLFLGLKYLKDNSSNFDKFNQKSWRDYERPDEERPGNEVFQANMKGKEAESGQSNGTLQFNTTKLADQTNDKLSRIYRIWDLWILKKKLMTSYLWIQAKIYLYERFPLKRPNSFDWREYGIVTSVKNQSGGSCWAFAAVASAESVYAIRTYELHSFSEQEMIACIVENGNYSEQMSSVLTAFQWMRKYGLVEEKFYSYADNGTGICQLSESNSTKRIYIDDWHLLPNDEDFIADWVAELGPVTCAMNVTVALDDYESEIYHPTEEECKQSNFDKHAVTIVGYGVEDGQPFWWVKNSWGDAWGKLGGYFKVARGQNACGIADFVLAPVVENL